MYNKWAIQPHGEVQEWLNWHAWNACMAAMSSRVRIPVSPPNKMPSNVWAFYLVRVAGINERGSMFCRLGKTYAEPERTFLENNSSPGEKL
jgi:hypothetical protein